GDRHVTGVQPCALPISAGQALVVLGRVTGRKPGLGLFLGVCAGEAQAPPQETAQAPVFDLSLAQELQAPGRRELQVLRARRQWRDRKSGVEGESETGRA